MRRVECECGFGVQGGDADVVSAAQRHARVVHHMELTSSFILAIARSAGAESGDSIDLTDAMRGSVTGRADHAKGA